MRVFRQASSSRMVGCAGGLGGQYVFCVFLHGPNTQCIQCILTKPSDAQPPPRSAGAPLLHLHHRSAAAGARTGSSGAGTTSSLASAAGATLAAGRARSGLGFAAGGMAVHEPRRLGFSRGGGAGQYVYSAVYSVCIRSWAEYTVYFVYLDTPTCVLPT